MRTALHTREDCSIDSGRDILYRIFWFFERIGNDSFTENQGSSRSSERFVRRRHHDMESVVQRIFQQSRSDETSDMRHVGECDSSDFLCDCYEFFVIQFSRIGGESCENDLRFMFQCEFADLFEIHLSIRRCLVSDEVEYFGEKRHGSSVREMSSVREVHSENRISRIHQCGIHAEIRCGAG